MTKKEFNILLKSTMPELYVLDSTEKTDTWWSLENSSYGLIRLVKSCAFNNSYVVLIAPYLKYCNNTITPSHEDGRTCDFWTDYKTIQLTSDKKLKNALFEFSKMYKSIKYEEKVKSLEKDFK